MSPNLALLLGWGFVAWLIVQDYRNSPRTLPGLWVPVLWFLIGGSRAPSYWFQPQAAVATASSIEDGNPLNLRIYLVLIILAIGILIRRGPSLSEIAGRNKAIFAFIAFCALSIIWADYPYISFKAFVKATVGNIAMVLVVLSEPDPLQAIKTLFRRATFVLIPMSVILIKYVPNLGRSTHRYSYETLYQGVAVNGNGLATTCFVCGLMLVWNLLDRKGGTLRREHVVDGVLLAMTAWLFAKGEGATGVLCLSIGISVLLMTRRTGLRPWALSIGRNLWVAVILIVPAVLANTGWFLNVVGNLFGRSETLLGRLDLWQVIGPLNGNPLLGVGYGSFWIGPRLQSLWNTYWWQPTQAHNGYVETYLTLGYVGLGLLIVTILTACRKATATTLRVELAALKLGFLLPIVLFNVTEAAFKGVHLIWFIFLLFAVETATEMQRKPAGNGLASAGPRVLAKRERLINGYEKPWPQVLKHFRDSRTGAAGRAEEALVRRETFGK